MKKSLKKTIEELEYAKKLHYRGAFVLKRPYFEKKANEKIVKQKEEVTKALKGEIPVTKKHIELVEKWRRTHWHWIAYLAHHYRLKRLSKAKEKEIEKEEKKGTVNWHFRWVKIYWWVIYYLKQKFKEQRLKNKRSLKNKKF